MALAMFGLHTNLKNMASAQFDGVDFKSIMIFDGKCVGANADGLFTIGSNDRDQYINADSTGTAIAASLEPAQADLDISNQKRLRKLYIGHESDGELQVVVKFDGEATGKTFSFSPEGTANKQRSAIVNCRRDQKGRYFSTKIQNVDGCDFSVDTIDGVVAILGRKPSGS